MCGLDPETVNKIKGACARIETIDMVVLYGSRAKGNYHAGSDIDITLAGLNLTSVNAVYPLMIELDELYLPYTFDISIFNNIDNAGLRNHIEKGGKVF